MKKTVLTICLLSSFYKGTFAAYFLHNDYSYLQEITFELYTDEVPAYKVPEQIKSIEETLMFEVLHATWKDKHWVAYTLNKNLLGTFKVGQPALLDNGDTRKIFFVAAFPGSAGGLDLYTAEYSNGSWSKPKNLGKSVNTVNNESNPGLLNDNTLTYSSGGIIKKLNLKTFKVVDLEETKVDDKKQTETVANVQEPIQETIAPVFTSSKTKTVNSTEPKNETPAQAVVVKESAPATVKSEEVQQVSNEPQTNNSTTAVSTVAKTTTPVAQDNSVKSMGVQTREAMLAKYKTAIQLGAFSVPKWDLIKPLSRFGNIISYKKDDGSNVVWIVGFSDRAAAEAVLPQVRATPGFENAYVTGK